MPLRQVNTPAFCRAFESQGLSVKRLSELSGVTRNTIKRLFRREVTPQEHTVMCIGRALGLDSDQWYEDVEIPDLRRDPKEWIGLRDVAMAAVSYAMRIVDICRKDPDCIEYVREQTLKAELDEIHKYSKAKVTDKDDPDDDKAHLLDLIASAAIWKILGLAFDKVSGKLAKGFFLFDEETGYVSKFVRDESQTNIAIFVDPMDDTIHAKRGLGGTCLISIYVFGPGGGWVVSVVGDFQRWMLFYRVDGDDTRGEIISPTGDVDAFLATTPTLEPPQGKNIPLRTSGRTEIRDAAANVYTAKGERLRNVATKGAKLVEAVGPNGEFLSQGGSRGPLLVLDGEIDLAIEYEKGFRPLDRIPGTFLADGVKHCTAVGLDGEPLYFGPDSDFETTLRETMKNWDPRAFEQFREKFVVAASPDLANQAVETLKDQID